MIVHVTVKTAKLEETINFYQWLLDLPISMRFTSPFGEIVMLGNDTKLELISDSSAEQISAKGLSVGFMVKNLDEIITMLDSKGIPHSDIISPMPKTRFIFLQDPNGLEIQLCGI